MLCLVKGCEVEFSVVSIDSCMLCFIFDSGEWDCYDEGKCKKGLKIYMVVDMLGYLLVFYVMLVSVKDCGEVEWFVCIV